jgi:tellurium resistance protein TerD
MAEKINLKKGQRINLQKDRPQLKRIRVETSWTPNRFNTGGKFDVDGSVFMCKKGPTPDQNVLIDNDYFIFYGKMTSPCGSITHSGDEKVGGKEILTINLTTLPVACVELSLVSTLHEAEERGQNFGQINQAAVLIIDDETNEQIAEYDLDENFSLETAVQLGSFYKNDQGQWGFKTVGAGYNLGLADFVKQYGGEVDE